MRYIKIHFTALVFLMELLKSLKFMAHTAFLLDKTELEHGAFQ